jgi:hypothetical protein
MKSDDQIRCRIRELLAEELDRRVREATHRHPRLCVHNHRQPLDERKEVYGEVNGYNRISNGNGEAVTQTIGLCMLGASSPEEWKGAICEDDLDAQRCPYFTPIETKDDIWDEFQRNVNDGPWLAAHLPAVSELSWALDPGLMPQLPWWKRLWYRWLLRIVVVPPLPVDDPALLPPGPDAPALPPAREARHEGVGS